GMQWPHPSERTRLLRLLAPTHRFRPGKCLHHFRDDLGDHLDRGPARLLDQRQVKVALLVGHDLGFADRFQPGGTQEALNGAFGRAYARPFLFLPHVGLAHRHALDREREAARGDESLGAFIKEPGADEGVGDALAQILGRTRLHARRNFLGEQFEQKIRHREQVAGAVGIVKSKSAGLVPLAKLSAAWVCFRARRHAAHLRYFRRSVRLMTILSRVAFVGAPAVFPAAAGRRPAAPQENETAYGMYLRGSEAPPAVPMRVVWDDTKPHISIDLGEKYEPALTKLKLPRVLEYDASRERLQFVVRDGELARFVKVVATSIVQGFLSASPVPGAWAQPAEVTVHTATLLVTPARARLEVTTRLHVTYLWPQKSGPPKVQDLIKGDIVFVGAQEGAESGEAGSPSKP